MGCVVELLYLKKVNEGRVHPGVASHWLYSLMKEKKETGIISCSIPAFIRTSTFRLPPYGRPAIMIGPGTGNVFSLSFVHYFFSKGIAPFMGFLQRRVVENVRAGDILFTGFRNKEEFYYCDQLQKWADDEFVDLHVAFSRISDKKHYVQHDLEKCKDKVWELINGRKANVYICGDANKMEKDVTATLLSIIAEQKGGDKNEAQAYLDKMVSSKQLQKDTWQ